MKKGIRVLMIGMLIAVFMAGSAWAGTTRANFGAANTAATVSLEAVAAGARNVTMNQAGAPAAGQSNNSALSYEITQNIQSGNFVRVTFTNAAFQTAQRYSIRAFNAGPGAALHTLANATPGAVSTYNFQLQFTDPQRPAGHIFLTQDGGADGAYNIQLPMGSAGAVTATIDVISAGNIGVDPASTATVANINQEFTPSINARQLWIDYINDPFDGTLFTADSSGNMRNVAANFAGDPGDDNQGFSITKADLNFGASAGTTDNYGLTSRAVVNVDAEWQGVNRIWVGNNLGCDAANNASDVVDNPSGAVALTIIAGAGGFNGTGGAADNNFALCVRVNGTDELQSRSIDGNVSVTIGGNVSSSVARGTFQNWDPNGFQAFVPHMRYSPTTRTFVRIVNNGARDADLRGTIRNPDGTTVADVDFGTLAAGETMNINAQDLGIANGLDATAANYAIQMSGNVTPNVMYVNAFMNLQVGGQWSTRDVTVYTSNVRATPLK